jgi:hypothetical protein
VGVSRGHLGALGPAILDLEYLSLMLYSPSRVAAECLKRCGWTLLVIPAALAILMRVSLVAW